MKRRDLLKSGLVGLGGVAAASTLSAPAIAKGRMEINMVSTWPRDFPGLGTGAQRFAKRLTDMSDGRIEVNYFAGGEPLMLGADYYRSVMAIQEKHCADTSLRIEHAMQSNLTLFTEDFVEIFRKMGIGQIGTSFDPEPHMRGGGADIDSELYNRKFFRGFNLAGRHGFMAGIIYVVTKKSITRAMDVFYYLTNLKLKGEFNMNPVLIYDEERQHIALSPEEYVEFLGEIFPVWWEHRDRYPDLEPFRSLVNTIINGQVSLGCVDSGNCAFNHINVGPDGETSQCGRSADWNILPYGNIHDHSIADILADEQRSLLMNRNDVLINGECSDCRFWSICHGGCPLDAWSKHKDFMHKTEWCYARKGFIEKYFETITGVRFTPGPCNEVKSR